MDSFTIILRKSGQELVVRRNETILEVLLAAGYMVPYSCSSGTCGVCMIKVLDGVPDHMDVILRPDQHAKNDRMFVCCSGSKTPTLVLDF